MADSRTITINLKAVSDFNDVVNNAKQIQTVLNKLKMPESLKGNFEKIFGDIEKYGNKAADSVAKGFKTKGDLSNFEKSVNSVSHAWEQLLKNLNRIDDNILKDSLDIDVSKLKEAEKEIEKYKQLISTEAGSKGLSNIESTLSGLVQQYKKVNGSAQEFINALKSGDIEKATKEYEKFSAAAGKIKDKDRQDAYVRLAEGMREVLRGLDTDKVKGWTDELAKAKINLENLDAVELQKLIEAFARGKGIIHEAAQEEKTFGENSVAAAQSMQNVNSELDHFKSRIAYFFGATNAVNLFKRALQSAFATVKDLDAVMTETAVVTKFDVGQMWEQLPEYTKRANELGVSIHSAYEAATIYYQQGLETNQVMEVSNQTLKMARIAGLDAAEATDRMTNALRGFNMEINEMNAERVADVYSKLAAMSASNVDEISTAMTKVASLASNANMEFETTAAFLAQMIETTRESAETAGTALKTVIARFSEVKSLYSKGELLGTDEEGEEIDVNKVSKALRTAGVNLNEYLTGMKGLDDIFIELASKWDSLDQIQQRYIATMAAGSRQQSRFIAMMQDYARTQELVGAAEAANGASQEQYQKTLESLETKLNRLKNAWDEFVMSIANNKLIKGVVDLLTGFIAAINKLTSSLPGALNGITKLGLAFGAFKLGKNVFNKGLAQAGQIFRKGTTDIGNKGAAGLVSGFTTGLKNRWGNLKGLNFIKNSPVAKDIHDTLYKQVAMQNPEAEAKDIERVANAGASAWAHSSNEADRLATTLNGAETAAARAGLQFKGLNEESMQAAIAQENLTNRLNTVQTTLMAAGTAAMIFGQVLKKIGVDDDVADGFTTFGMILTGIGALLPVLGAAVTGFGTTVATAGAVAQAGWGWIGLILAAVAALVTLAISASNKAQKEIDKLKDRTEKAEEATKNLQDKYDDLRESIDSIFSKRNQIDNMVEGTNAWRQAVQELNSQVLDLIEKFPELIKYLHTDNGIFSINAEDIEAVYKDYADKIARQQVAKSFLNIEKRNAEDNRKAENLGNKLGNRPAWETDFLNQIQGRAGNENTAFSSQYIIDVANALNRNTEALEKFKEGGIYEATDDFKNFLEHPEDNEAFYAENKEIIDDLRNFAKELDTTHGLNTTEYEGMAALSLDNLVDTYGQETVDLIRGFLNSGSIEAALAEGSQKTYDELGTEEKIQYEDYFSQVYGSDLKQIKDDGRVDLKEGPDLTAEEAMREFQAYMLPEVMGNAAEGLTNALLSSPGLRNLLEGYGRGEQQSFSREQLDQISDMGGIDAVIQQILDKSGYAEGDSNYIALANMLNSGLKVEVINSDQILKSNSEYAKTDFSAGGVSALSELQKIIGSGSGKQLSSDELLSLMGLGGLKEAMGSDFSKVGDALEKITDFTDKGQIEGIKDYIERITDPEAFAGFEEQLDIFVNNLINNTNAIKKVNASTALSEAQKAGTVIKQMRSGEQGSQFTKEAYDAISQFLTEEEKQNFVDDGNDGYMYLGNSMTSLQSSLEANTGALLNNTQAYYENQIKGAEVGEETLKSSFGLNPEEAGLLQESQYADFLNNFLANSDRELIKSLGIEGLSKDTDAYNLAETNPELLNQFVDALLLIIQNKQANEAELNNFNNSIGTTGQTADQVATMGGTDAAVRQATMSEAQDWGLDPEQVKQTSAAYQELNENLKENQALSDRIALDNMRMNKSLEEISSNIDKWKTSLDPASENTDEYNQAILDVQESIRGLTGVTKDVSRGFAASAKAMELLERAANGDLDAITELRKAAAEDIVMQMHLDPEAEGQVLTAIDDIMSSAEYNDLEIGVSLQDTAFYEALQGLLDAGVITTNQMNDILEGIGFEPTVEMETVTVDSINTTDQTAEVIGADGEKRTVHLTNDMEVGGTIQIPRIGNSKFKGAPAATVTPSNRGGGGKGGGGGGGGGGKAEKPTYWENPYDELYNLTEKINEALRTREALERRYQKIAKLGVTTAGQMRKAFTDQIEQLKREIELQKQLQAGRLRQIQNVGNQIYTDKEGNRSTFSQLGVTRYASYNKDTGLIQIDWNAIDAVSRDPNRSEEGEAIEAYISKLEELVEGYEEIRDTIWDMEDELEDIIQQSIDDYLDFESRVYDAMVAAREKEIEAYGALSDAIQDSTSRVLDKMQEQIEDERQARENDKTEEEIADREARLAYLSRDTSGANQLEIMKLQQEIDDARQNYTDTLIDQAIQEMQKDADKAAEQREQQQALLEAQLKFDEEQGIIMAQVEEILRNSFSDDQAISMNDEELKKLLQDNEAFKNMSSIGKEEWLRGFIESWNKAQSGYKADEEKRKAEEAAAAAAQSTTPSTPTTTTPKQPAASTPKYPLPLSDDTAKGIATSICFVSGGGGWGNWPDRENRLVAKFGNGAYWKVQQYVEQIVAAGWSNLWGKDGRKYTYASFKTGGLADFTGPAWLDGSRSHPEMVLNAADTENLIMLKDILNSILKRTSNAFGTAASELNFDIDINADLSSDYDVEQLADKVKGIIYDEAMYKNVNTVNRLR